MNTELAKKIRSTADADNLPSDHPMRVAGQDFEDAANGYFSEPQTVSVKKFLGCFAKARRLWREYKGEPLV